MEKVKPDTFKYVVIQYDSKENNEPRYIVISFNWLKRIGDRTMFYWPLSDWAFNVTAVKKCTPADPETWLIAPVKAIATYSNDFYNAVLCAIVLSRFRVNASTMTHDELRDFVKEIMNCPQCSKEVRLIAKAMTCTCLTDKKNVSKLPSVSSSQSPLVRSDEANKSDGDEVMSPSLLSIKKYAPAPGSIASTSCIPSRQRASVERDCIIDRATHQNPSYSDSDESSPSLLKRRKTVSSPPMSPSLLSPKTSRKRTEHVKICLLNKFQ